MLEAPGAKLFARFVFNINKQNIVKGTPETIIKSTNITAWEFKVGIKELKRYNIIRKYTAKEYMLNPDVSYNGDDRRYYVLKHMWDTQTTTGLKEA